MSEGNDNERRATRARHFSAREIVLLCLIVLGLGGAASLARWLEVRQPKPDAQAAVEELYINAQTARRMSLSFNGLVADWYWLRALQYVGRKSNAYQGTFQIDDLSPLNLKLLAPLLDTATTLDPQFLAPYQFAAVVLPAVDTEAAIKLVQKGIAANPGEWRLYSQLGYIYWQGGRYSEAAAAYRTGAQVPGARAWMNAMAGMLAAQGGSRVTAREIYRRLSESDDQQLRELAIKRLLQLQSWDERDALRRFLEAHRSRNNGRCAAAWRDVSAQLRAARVPTNQSGAPLDPSGVPYALVPERCEVELSEGSEILRK